MTTHGKDMKRHWEQKDVSKVHSALVEAYWEMKRVVDLVESKQGCAAGDEIIRNLKRVLPAVERARDETMYLTPVQIRRVRGKSTVN